MADCIEVSSTEYQQYIEVTKAQNAQNTFNHNSNCAPLNAMPQYYQGTFQYYQPAQQYQTNDSSNAQYGYEQLCGYQNNQLMEWPQSQYNQLPSQLTPNITIPTLDPISQVPNSVLSNESEVQIIEDITAFDDVNGANVSARTMSFELKSRKLSSGGEVKSWEILDLDSHKSVKTINGNSNSQNISSSCEPVHSPILQGVLNHNRKRTYLGAFNCTSQIPGYFHTENVHNTNPVPEITSTQPHTSSALTTARGRPKLYNCTACDKWYTSTGHLKRHYNTNVHKNAVRLSGKADPASTNQDSLITRVSKTTEAKTLIQATEPTRSIGQYVNLPLVINHNETGAYYNTVNTQLNDPKDNQSQVASQSPIFQQMPQNNYIDTPNTGYNFCNLQPLKSNEPVMKNLSYNVENTFSHTVTYHAYQNEEKEQTQEHTKWIEDETLNMYNIDDNKENFSDEMELSSNSRSDYDSANSLASSTESNPLTENNRNDNVNTISKCLECNKTFNKSCYLTQHNNTFHAGLMPYRCTRCGKKYRDEATYQRHLSKHTDAKPHKCTECPKSFNYKVDLRRHMCSHSNDKPYSCHICNKRFIRQDHMLKHCEIHTRKSSTCS